jgi:SAM-dependent methyltransferase
MTAAAASAGQVDFDAIAGIYDDVFAPHVTAHYLQRRVDYIRRYAPARTALDVGAGTGRLAARLAGHGLRVAAADPFPAMLERLRRRDPRIETVVARGDALPFADGAFDLAYSVAVMHHIADPRRVRGAIAEMVRVTRPGGRVLIWDHNPLNPYWPLLMRRVPQDNGSERLIPLRELVAAVEDAGAVVLRAERRGLMPEFVPRRLLRPAAALERAVEATPGLRLLCSHNVVLAAKR